MCYNLGRIWGLWPIQIVLEPGGALMLDALTTHAERRVGTDQFTMLNDIFIFPVYIHISTWIQMQPVVQFTLRS